MSDNTKKRGKQDRQRINFSQSWERMRWSWKLNCSDFEMWLLSKLAKSSEVTKVRAQLRRQLSGFKKATRA